GRVKLWAGLAGRDAGSKFPAFGDGEVGGGVDGTRVGPVAIEEGVVGIAPPDGHRDGVEHFTQALSLPSRAVGDRDARSIDEPENVLATGGPPALNQVGAAAARRDVRRERNPRGSQRQPSRLEARGIVGAYPGEKFRISRRFGCLANFPSGGVPTETAERNSVENSAAPPCFTKLPPGAQQQSARSKRHYNAQRIGELDHGRRPHGQTRIYRRSIDPFRCAS